MLEASEKWFSAHLGIAAWLQAVGTPVALALTVWATLHAAGAARRLANRDVEAFVDRLEQQAHLVLLDVGARQFPWADGSFLAASVGRHRDLVRGLVDTPAIEWPDPRLHQALLNFDAELQAFSDAAAALSLYGPEGEIRHPLPPFSELRVSHLAKNRRRLGERAIAVLNTGYVVRVRLGLRRSRTSLPGPYPYDLQRYWGDLPPDVAGI